MSGVSEEGARSQAAIASHTNARADHAGRPALPVTDADVDAFHEALYARPENLEHVPVPPITNDMWGRRWREDLRRAIAADRARVAVATTTTSQGE